MSDDARWAVCVSVVMASVAAAWVLPDPDVGALVVVVAAVLAAVLGLTLPRRP